MKNPTGGSFDRFNLAIDVIDRAPQLQRPGAHLKEWLKGQIIESLLFYTVGLDKAEIRKLEIAGAVIAKYPDNRVALKIPAF